MLNTIKEIMYQAGDIAMQYFQGSFDVETKSNDYDLVSTVDKEVDIYITKELSKYFPDDQIISEESTTVSLIKNKRVWFVDPIDGTYSFVHGKHSRCIFIGLSIEGKPSFGAMYSPSLGELYIGEKGKGTYKIPINGSKKICTVSLVSDSKKSNVVYLEQFEKYISSNQIDKLKKSFPKTEIISGNPFQMLLDKKIDGSAWWLPHGGGWDICAPSILIEEAGGVFTDEKGDEINFLRKPGNTGWIASNYGIHEDFIKSIVSL